MRNLRSAAVMASARLPDLPVAVMPPIVGRTQAPSARTKKRSAVNWSMNREADIWLVIVVLALVATALLIAWAAFQ